MGAVESIWSDRDSRIMQHWSDFESNVTLFMCRTKCIIYASESAALERSKHAHYCQESGKVDFVQLFFAFAAFRRCFA